jgi:hypothetical protein
VLAFACVLELVKDDDNFIIRAAARNKPVAPEADLGLKLTFGP